MLLHAQSTLPTRSRRSASALSGALARPAACACLLLIAGCAGTPAPRTTLLQARDIESTTTDVREALASSEWLATRSSTSDPALLQPQPLVNISDNRLTPGDEWAAMSRVALNPAILDLLAGKNIRVQMPALVNDRLGGVSAQSIEPAASIAPTHLLSATLRSLTRAADQRGRLSGESTVRKDTFLVEYTVTDVRTRTVVWSHTSRFARVAEGSLVD